MRVVRGWILDLRDNGVEWYWTIVIRIRWKLIMRGQISGNEAARFVMI
jgi:hypothetical protein